LQSGYFNGSISAFEEEKLANELCDEEWGYAIDLDMNEFRTFQGKEIHFWRFALDAIPSDLFEDTSIRAFNRIVNDEALSYNDVEAYNRFYEEEKQKIQKEQEEKEQLKKKARVSGDQDESKSSKDAEGAIPTEDAKMPAKV
jgi:hypothetical protein